MVHFYAPRFVLARSSDLSKLGCIVKIRTHKNLHDRENTYEEQVFSRYEPAPRSL